MRTQINIFVIVILASCLTYSCTDVLDVEPQGALVEGVEMDAQIMDKLITSVYAGLTSRFINLHHVTFQGPTSNWIADVRSDDAYKGGGGIVNQVPIHQCETYTLNASNDIAYNKWLNLTWAISRVNNALRTLDAYQNPNYPKATRSAELRFLRGHFMFDLLRNYNHVPWLDDKTLATDASNRQYQPSEVLAKIIEDFKAAYDVLPTTQPESARVNKLTAAAYLAKAYTENKQWDEAIKYADEVINSGKFGLIKEFEDLATIEEENGREMVFTVQFAYTQNPDLGHNIGNILNVTYSNVYPGGDDFYLGSQNLINAFKTDQNGLPLFDTFNVGNDITDSSYSNNIDARLDFTFGRPGVPWKKTGVYTYPEWRRSLDYERNYSAKKHVIDAGDPRIYNVNLDPDGKALEDGSDAVAALRGYVQSELRNSSIILSGGMNPRLFAYMEKQAVWDPDANGHFDKKIVIKVSDYRSALIQGKMLAKKGLWVSEFRIESGLNCGGHAFATDDYLLGPILEEFKVKKSELTDALFTACNEARMAKGKKRFEQPPAIRITIQGGIGTSDEDELLRTHYFAELKVK